MGSSGSKAAASNQSAASSSKTRRSRGGWAFQSACLGAPSGSRCNGHQDQVRHLDLARAPDSVRLSYLNLKSLDSDAL